ncbi:MAG: hypothetical protein HUK13_04860, partial [Muribaculaceae bacterium]|nr:hypothetical protein [Muribaculaceae bacterium]
MRKIILSLITLATALTMGAQIKIHNTLGMELFHLWRGLEVSKGLNFTDELSFSDKNDHFRIG